MESVRTERNAWFAVALLTLSACDRPSNIATANVTTRDSSGMQVVESAAPLVSNANDSLLVQVESLPELSIGVEEGDENYQLHRVSDARRLADGRIVIANSGTGELRIFDATGKYMQRVGRRGSGPGEFEGFSSMQLHALGDSLLSDDNGAFRLHLLGPDLTFVETRGFDLTGGVSRPFMQGTFDDGTLLVLGYAGGGTLQGAVGSILKSTFALYRFGADGKRMNDIVTVESRPRYVHQFGNIIHYPYIPLTAEPLNATSGNEVLLLRRSAPEIEVFDQSGKVVRVIRWARAAVNTSDVWPSYRETGLNGLRGERKAQYEHFYAEQLPLPEHVPPYVTMRVDDERRIWLERFRIPGDTIPTWDILDRSGTWLGSARTPRGFRPFHIGTDFLLGSKRDSLDVETVQLLRMQKHPQFATLSSNN